MFLLVFLVFYTKIFGIILELPLYLPRKFHFAERILMASAAVCRFFVNKSKDRDTSSSYRKFQ